MAVIALLMPAAWLMIIIKMSAATMAMMMMMKGAATNTDGNDGDNEVKLRAAKTRRGADAGSRTGRAASRMQQCSATTGWKVSSVSLRSHTRTHRAQNTCTPA